MLAILNFLQKCKNAKIDAISLTVRDGAISSKFSTSRVSRKYTKPTFQKIFKNGGHFEFLSFCPKNVKTQIYAISLTVKDRAISSKFSTSWVPNEYTIPTSRQFFKKGGHFEFSNFSKECENTKLLLSP